MFLVDILIKFHKLNFSMVNIDVITKKRVDQSRVGNKLMSNLKILKIAYKTWYR